MFNKETLSPNTGWRPKVIYDKKNPAATAFGKIIPSFNWKDKPNIILVLGGDGFMLKTIRENIDRNLPFYGLNYGHLGFLLNDPKDFKIIPPRLETYTLPVMVVEYTDSCMTRYTNFAINDVWMERATAQSAWFRVSVNDEIVLSKVVGDAMLAATPQGSTAYARSMGGEILPLNSNHFQLIGSNVCFPSGWKKSIIRQYDRVDIHVLDPEKRPSRLYIDGISPANGEEESYDYVYGLTVYMSGQKGFKLAFNTERTLEDRILRTQFAHL